MSKLVIVIVAGLLAVGSLSAQNSWDAIGKAWGEYLEYPSNENCVALYDVLPENLGVLNFESDSNGIADSLYQNLEMLCYQIMVLDRDAIRVGFKLFAVADGDFAETLDVTLGATIRRNPQMFLEELYNHKRFVSRLDGLTGNFGDPFVDRFLASDLETELRIQALESVQVDSLQEVKDRCIKELREQIEE